MAFYNTEIFTRSAQNVFNKLRQKTLKTENEHKMSHNYYNSLEIFFKKTVLNTRRICIVCNYVFFF